MSGGSRPGLPRRILARARSWARGVFRRGDVEAEMLEEFRHHIEMRTEDLVREGLTRRQAARRARREFGHVESWRNEARAARGLLVLDRLRFSWIDVKLGARMLRKHPGLTLVAGFALAVGIPVGLAPMHLAEMVEAPLPEDPENRIRSIRLWDPATQSLGRVQYDDYRHWQDDPGGFAALGAYQAGTFGVADGAEPAHPVYGARLTASVFDMLRTRPRLGRALDRRDETPGAPDVAVIGHDLWRSRFAADPDIVGRTLRVAGDLHTVVGVMPEGFRFPHLQQVWLPLRHTDIGGPSSVHVIGRMADGVHETEVQAELITTGLHPRPEEPGRGRLRPEVVPFALGFAGIPRGGVEALPEFVFFQIAALVLLLVACGNVAMLVFARTATRFREMAVRTALGASRGRIVVQIFAEALVLAVGAAAVGVAVISWAMGRVNLGALAGEAAVPYWLSFRPTPRTVLWALGLAVGSAVVAGVVPALRITGQGIQGAIQRAQAGRSGIRFGGVTGFLIVADVALSVVVLTLAAGLVERMTDTRRADQLAGIPAAEYLAVEVRLPGAGGWAPPDPVALQARRAEAQRLLVERLSAEPAVRSVGAADALPRMNHRGRIIEVEGQDAGPDASPRYVRTATVDPDYFEALATPILAGRGFDRGDLREPRATTVVNTVFVERTLGGSDPLGRRIRFPGRDTDPDAPWLEIVGVVGHLGANMVSPAGDEAVYLPAAPGEIQPLHLAVHVRGAATASSLPLREVAASIDPDLVVEAAVPLERIHQGDWYLTLAVAGGLALLVGILVALAASGLYAIMSFAVSERTREIGIRTALGAPRTALLFTILRRSLVQIALGAVIGLPLAAWALADLRPGSTSTPGAVATAVGLALAIVTAVALCSCLVPARRILSVEAGDALRAEG